MLPASDAYRDCKRLKDSQLALIGAIRQANGRVHWRPAGQADLMVAVIPTEGFSPRGGTLCFVRPQNGIPGVSIVTTVMARSITHGSTMASSLMRPYVQIVQKRLPAPPLIRRLEMSAFASILFVLATVFWINDLY